MANIITAGNSTNGGTSVATDTSGTLNIVTGSGSGSNAITIDASQAVVMPGNLTVSGTLTASGGVSGGIRSGTAVASTSGTSIDFTSLPTGLKRITVMFNGVSVSSTANLLIQGGVGGTIDSSGYASSSTGTSGGAGGTASSTSGYVIRGTSGTISLSGQMVLTLLGSNIWVSSHACSFDGSGSGVFGGGTNTFSGTLDTIRITTTSTDTFDAGSINILYE